VAGRIRQEDIEAVRERTDLVKLVSQYLTLKKAGHDSLVGVCPFHTEKTPSFSVSPSKQVYYCFGCGAGGDAVRFLREVEHLDFRETIERLAKDYAWGMDLQLCAFLQEGWTNVPGAEAIVREALKRGLKYEDQLGVNPFKFGMMSSAINFLRLCRFLS
jgi:DNA primase catalytic core